MNNNPFAAELEERAGGGTAIPNSGEPANPFAAELASRSAPRPSMSGGISFKQGFGRSALNTFLDNLLAVPSLVVEAATPLSPAVMFGTNEEARAAIDERRDRARSMFPSGKNIRAGMRAATELPGQIAAGELDLAGAYARGMDAEAEADERFAQEAPVGTKMGEFAGDAATVLSGRLPIRAAMRKAAAQAPAAAAPAAAKTGFRGQLDDLVNSHIAQNLKRGGLRVTEAGLEGAMLAALKDEDPMTAAAITGGAQAGGSLMLTAAKEAFGSKSRFLTSLALSAVGVQLFKELTPGGADRITQSMETAVTKLVPLAMLGTLGAFAGAGRVGGSMEKNLPQLADALTAIPRGSMQSLLRDLAAEKTAGQDTTMRVLTRFSENPDAFTPAHQRMIDRALKNGRASEVVTSLMKNRDFRRRIEGDE